jgi:EAL domain-containing protein (putative c-di-GMP-specific phosphodiesterase class I)
VRHSQHGEVLNELCRNGFHLILDSFGTGYAPLNLLKEVPYSLIKLSDTFVATCEVSKSDQAIIKGVVDMVHQLGIQVLAASVDSEAQHTFLENVGCDWFSGEAIAKDLEQTPQKLDAMGIFVFPG